MNATVSFQDKKNNRSRQFIFSEIGPRYLFIYYARFPYFIGICIIYKYIANIHSNVINNLSLQLLNSTSSYVKTTRLISFSSTLALSWRAGTSLGSGGGDLISHMMTPPDEPNWRRAAAALIPCPGVIPGHTVNWP